MTSAVLTRDTLVLNRSWVAIATTPVRHALSLLFTGSARAIQPETYETHDFASWSALDVPEGEPSVSTVRLELRVPEVVVLSVFGGVPRQVLPFTRRNLVRRDQAQCQYCGRRPTTSELSIDHVVPRALGGETSWENCVLACVHCNRRKGSKLVHDANMRLMKAPAAPQWSPIFEVAGAQQREAWRPFVAKKHWSPDRHQSA
ncbi:MAG: HNH endonuclease [Planctomycetota bacterium]